MAGMSCAFIHIDTMQQAFVLVAAITFARRLTISNDAGAVGTTIDIIAGTLTNEVHAMFGQVAVSVSKAIHSNTSSIFVVRVASEQACFRAVTLPTVVEDTANSIRTAWVVSAGIDATRYTRSVAGSVLRTIDVAPWAFARV